MDWFRKCFDHKRESSFYRPFDYVPGQAPTVSYSKIQERTIVSRFERDIEKEKQ